MKASLRCYHSQTEYRMQPGRVSPVRINEHFLFGAENTMASDVMIEFTDGNFQAEAMESDVPVLVDFWAEWCQPCKMLTPTIEAIAEEYAGRAKVGKMNIDDHKQVALSRNIQSIPTVLIFKGGEVAQTFVGITPKEKMAEALDAAM